MKRLDENVAKFKKELNGNLDEILEKATKHISTNPEDIDLSM